MAYLGLYERLAKANPVFLKYMVEYLPVKEKEQIIQDLDMVAKLTQQTEAQQQELNTLSGMLQNSLRQQSESEIRQDVSEASLQIDKIKAEQEIVLKEMKSTQKMQNKQQPKSKETPK